MEEMEKKGNPLKKLMWPSLALLLLGGILTASWLFWGNPEVTDMEGHEVPEASHNTLVDAELIENGIHLRTGFVVGEGMQEVINNCTNCHSPKLVIQNRMDREGWENTIRWMQETQNLWDLGPQEEVILNYLAKHYAPTEKGRRERLKNVEWYTLK
jgi:hypothetical protein